jgi:hypothetical protein
MVTCRPDISLATVKCAQSTAAPADIHVKAGQSVMLYLYRIYYRRSEPNDELPDHPLPALSSNPSDILSKGRPIHRPYELHGYMPSLAFVYAWQVAPLHTRHVFNRQLLYRLPKQSLWLLLIVQTRHYIFEAFFMILISLTTQHIYTRTKTDVLQQKMRENNNSTHHMDIQYNTLCEWVERDLVVLEPIDTSQNPAGHFTKNPPRILFHRHVDYIMGHIPPPHN